MGRKADITEFIHGKIVALNEMGINQSQIARQLKISRSSVQRQLKRSSGVSNRLNSGRKRCSTPRGDRFIKSLVTATPTISSETVAAQARGILNIQISARTVRRRLCQNNLPARRPSKKPLLTETQRLKRLKFCNQYKDKTKEWWEQVMFTDESTFQQVRSCGYNYIRRPPNKRYDPKYTIKTVKHPPSVMCWGAITAHGRAGLSHLPNGARLNSAGYIKILQENVQIHMGISGTTIFQQDSAPCHTSKVVKKWFSDNNVTLLSDWPSSSPDLNAIENCWSVMKRKVAEHCPTSEADLIKILHHVWVTEISPDYCRGLVHSMPDRIKAVIANKGYPCKY